MFGSIWAFLNDPGNRAVLSWVGGGMVVVVGGIWAVVKFFFKKDDNRGAKPGVSAEGGSVAIGGDNRNSPISIRTKGRGKR